MPNQYSRASDFAPFGKLLSLLALLAAGLYFIGWVYRWTYYSFFHVEVTTLNLPFESFYLASFQVLLGHPLIIVRTFGAVLLIGLAILVFIKLRRRITTWLARKWPWLRKLASTNTLSFLAALADEIIGILLIVAILFWIAQKQAETDALRDAVNTTSTLPVVTVILPSEEAALGRDIDNPLMNPTGLRIIGDQELYNRIRGNELTSIENPDQPRVWRLLSNRDGYFYIFPALAQKDPTLSFPVLIINESNSRLTILSPEVVQ